MEKEIIEEINLVENIIKDVTIIDDLEILGDIEIIENINNIENNETIVKVDWNKINNDIKNLKYPLSFLFNIFSNSEKINDKNLSLIIRFYLKYHNNIAIENYIVDLLILVDEKKILTKKIVNDFYKLISKKIKIAKSLEKWKNAYNKNNFWNKNILEQINLLENIKMIFYSNYDICKSNTFFHNKIYNILLFNKKDTFNLNQLINRLRNIYLMFGKKFFDEYKIISLKKNKFIEFELKNKIKYCNYIFQKINKILIDTINLLQIYNYNNNQLNNLINPTPISFKNNYLDSDVDLDDILFMIKN